MERGRTVHFKGQEITANGPLRSESVILREKMDIYRRGFANYTKVIGAASMFEKALLLQPEVAAVMVGFAAHRSLPDPIISTLHNISQRIPSVFEDYAFVRQQGDPTISVLNLPTAEFIVSGYSDVFGVSVTDKDLPLDRATILAHINTGLASSEAKYGHWVLGALSGFPDEEIHEWVKGRGYRLVHNRWEEVLSEELQSKFTGRSVLEQLAVWYPRLENRIDLLHQMENPIFINDNPSGQFFGINWKSSGELRSTARIIQEILYVVENLGIMDFIDTQRQQYGAAQEIAKLRAELIGK